MVKILKNITCDDIKDVKNVYISPDGNVEITIKEEIKISNIEVFDMDLMNSYDLEYDSFVLLESLEEYYNFKLFLLKSDEPKLFDNIFKILNFSIYPHDSAKENRLQNFEFTNCVFLKGPILRLYKMILKSCVLNKCVFFNNISFKGDVDIEVLDSVFYEYMTFVKEFGGMLNKVVFTECQFYKGLDISRKKWLANIEFKNSVFKGNVSAYDSEFQEKIDFFDSQFEKGANFSNSKFQNGAYFHKSTFNVGADFSKSKFKGVTNFKVVKFSNANFSETEFENEVKFSASEFNDKTDFHLSNFLENGIFNCTTFDAEVNFSNSNVLKDLEICQAHFKEGLNLGFCTMNGMLNLTNTTVGELLSLENSCKDIGGICINLKKSKINSISPSYLNVKDAPNRETFTILKYNAVQHLDQISALRYHTQEYSQHYADLKWSSKNFVQKIILFVEKYSSNFGTNPLRAFIFYVAVTLFYATCFEKTIWAHVHILDYAYTNLSTAISDLIVLVTDFSKYLISPSFVEFMMPFKIFAEKSLTLPRLILSIIQSVLLYEMVKSFRQFSRKI